MISGRVLFASLVVIFLLGGSGVVAAGFTCGGRIVEVGDTTYEVLAKCGEPNYRDVFFDSETWFYDFGPHKFIRILTFVYSKLYYIEKGRYGTVEGQRLREELNH